MSDPETVQRQTPDALMLYGFWYRALPSDRVRRQLAKAMLLDTPLVLGRDGEGRPFALHDACPHRGMPLSCGHFDGGQVECSYHGWRFDAHSGQCQVIPSLTADQKLRVDRIYAGNYTCEEHDSFIWGRGALDMKSGIAMMISAFLRLASASIWMPIHSMPVRIDSRTTRTGTA